MRGFRSIPSDLPIFLFPLFSLTLSGCERGCGWGWLREHGVGGLPPPTTSGSLPFSVIDCPDGLARCAKGSVEASRLAVIPQPCRGPESACACPWGRIASCGRGCVAEELEVVIDSVFAATQLCAPDPHAGPVAHPSKSAEATSCEDGQLYRCAGGAIIDCAARALVASCVRGCFAEGASLDDALPVQREAAFAILCSR